MSVYTRKDGVVSFGGWIVGGLDAILEIYAALSLTLTTTVFVLLFIESLELVSIACEL